MLTLKADLNEAILRRDISELKKLLKKRKELSKTPTAGDVYQENDGNLFHVLVHSRHRSRSFREFTEDSEETSRVNVVPIGDLEADRSSSEFTKLDPGFLQSLENFESDVPWKWLELGGQTANDDETWKTVAYILSEEEVEDINATDHLGQTPLYIACCFGDAVLCDALLQCGADPNFVVGLQPIISHVTQFAINEELVAYRRKKFANKQRHGEECKLGPARVTFEICKFYWPGLWNAVEVQSIENVRRLLNSWSKTSLKRDGQTLYDLALDGGNETIISLLYNIAPTIDLIYKVLARDEESLLRVRESPSAAKINWNLKKLSERGASLLYFLIRSGEGGLVKNLVERGASPFTLMSDHDEIEFPVIFTAIQPEVNDVMISVLLHSSSSELSLDMFWYKGKTLLQEAVAKQIPEGAIRSIIEKGGPYLLADRDPTGNTVIEELLLQGHEDLVGFIGNLVFQWVTQPDLHPGWREILMLRGFSYLEKVGENFFEEISMEKGVAQFFKEALFCQDVVEKLFEAVHEGDVESFKALCETTFSFNFFHINDILLHGRPKGDGMALLHRVVLMGQVEILELILNHLFNEATQKSNLITKRLNLDEVRDQWRRTPMHYGYGLSDGGPIRRLLSSTGASEHSLDMFYKEPMDFKDASGSQEMEKLLDALRRKDYNIDQEEPWRPNVLRRHQERKRRQRFENEAKNPSHHHHHHYGLPSYYKFNQDFLRPFQVNLSSAFCRNNYDERYTDTKQNFPPYGPGVHTFGTGLQGGLKAHFIRSLETNNNSSTFNNNNVSSQQKLSAYFNCVNPYNSPENFNQTDDGKGRSRGYCLIM